jgi:Ca2+-binding RTX toxin-like protein
MSFIDPPDSTIWNLPNQDPSNVDTWTDDPNLVDGTDGPVQVGGVGNTWATTTAPAGTPAQVVLSGENNTLSVGFGPAEIQSIGGGGNIIESVQVLGDGTKIISTGNFGQKGGAEFTTTVNENASTTGDLIGESSTISAMAGDLSPFLYSYVVGGTGDDLLYGSSFSDFLRGGAGDDTIYAFGGNDIVRGGAGSDLITLGTGNDTLYYTADQLQDGDIDTVTDFNDHEGETDILAIQADRVGGTGSFGGFGTNSLAITDSVDGSVTRVVAQPGYEWKQADIFFVV